MEISQRIKMERQAAKWTQDQLADKIFVSKRTISNWETGRTVPDIESVLHLSKVFQVSLDDLLVADSAVVKEIKRKEKIANLTGLYYIGPVLTGIILILMMYLPSAIVHGGILYFVTAALLTNFITLTSFKWKIARLKGEEEKFHKEMKRTKIAGASVVVITCIFLIILYFI
ncbi:helix-turn-helix transcriptional regulator [Enterococcus hulanensis]|uniref:helix-turn-helix domain-containing protein n=1 Tax=Enterococcus hulanensis TaxID=2559929 RepID=UPI001A8F4246|nr:helix-turn-helix transcriptional regulator [Enterococcus hulanensis]MBO0456504.1 helix-turn-helix transcriptional regulator [Enterococcus hulanensis]